jgi:hypothetical protein
MGAFEHHEIILNIFNVVKIEVTQWPHNNIFLLYMKASPTNVQRKG